jgi:hypothetical protein
LEVVNARTKLARRPDRRAAHEEDALPQQRGLLQAKDQRAKQVEVLQNGQGRVVLGQALLILGDRRDGRDGAVAKGALAVCVLCLGPAGLICPELLQRRRRLVLRQHRRQLF